MSISSQDLQRAVTPLRLIFWGGLVCLIDLGFAVNVSPKVGGGEWKLDLLDDLVGMAMITWGTYQLGRIRQQGRYGVGMLLVTGVAALSCLEALHGHLARDAPRYLSLLWSVLGPLKPVAAVGFCLAMRWLCKEAGLRRSERSWRTSALLFGFVYLVPVALLASGAVDSMAAMGAAHEGKMGAGAVMVLMAAVAALAVPLLHLFASTRRMRAEAQSATEPGDRAPVPEA